MKARLENDERVDVEKMRKLITCIECNPTMFFSRMTIINAGKSEPEGTVSIGRMKKTQFYDLQQEQVDNVYNHLWPVVFHFKNNPQEQSKTLPTGQYNLLYPFDITEISKERRTTTQIIKRRPETKTTELQLLKKIPLSILGEIEGIATGLENVIIICNKIEDPMGDNSMELVRSVKDNFKRGVKYYFLISPSNIEQQEGYYEIFKGYAHESIRKKKLYTSLDQLINIQPLDYEWSDYPYIFYRCKTEVRENPYFSFAFRGTESGAGISELYVFVEPEVAHTLLSSTLKANKNVKIVGMEKELNSKEFIDENTVRASIVKMW